MLIKLQRKYDMRHIQRPVLSVPGTEISAISLSVHAGLRGCAMHQPD